MSSKRDYYEVLGVPKDADDAALKKAYRVLAKNIIRTPIREMRRQRLNSRKHPKPMLYLATHRNVSSMTSLDMQHLKMAVAEQEPVDSILISVTWVTFLAIFLAIYSVAEDVETAMVL